MREEDFSIRARGARPDDAMGEVMIEVNALSTMLREQRLGAMEATGLLRIIIEEIDLAIFTFDDETKLRLVNRAGERLLARPIERLLGSTAEELRLAACLEGESARTMDLAFPGASGRWSMRRGSFRQGGLPHHLVVLSDLSRTLRDEERQAWQRLIRVLGHELNNSLAPIQSVAQGLESGLNAANQLPELRTGPAAPILEDLQQGLGIIRSRTEALGRFMAAYARLARLPKPKLLPVRVADWVNRTAKIETRVKVCLKEGHRRRRSPPTSTSSNNCSSIDSQRRRRLARNTRRCAGRLVAAGLATGGLGDRRRSRHPQYREPVRSVFHHQARRFRHRPGAQQANRRSPRRRAHLKNRVGTRGCEARLRLPL